MSTSTSSEIAVVGGGIIGSAVARELARRGRRVVVFERERVGWGASSRNSGFIRITGRDIEELPLILHSVARWTELALLPGADFDYVRAGSLWVASNQAELATIDRIVERQERAGLAPHLSRLLDRAATRRLLPTLGDFALGALFGALDGHVDQTRATEALANLARAAGAEIRSGAAVEAIETQAGAILGVQTSEGPVRAEAVVLAAGAWSSPLALGVGRRLPIAVRRGQAVRTVPVPRITDLAVIAPQPTTGHVAIRQMRSGRVTISGYQRPDYAGLDQEPTEETLQLNHEAALRALPCLADAPIEARWAGLNEATLDNLPLLGPDPRAPGLFIATGFSGHGFGIAPSVGELMADLVTRGQTDHPIEPFRVDRFDHLDIEAALERYMANPAGGLYVTREDSGPRPAQT